MFLDNFKDKNQIINKIRALYYILQDKFTDTQLYSKAGDVIYFSALLSHIGLTNLTNKLKVGEYSIDDNGNVIYFQEVGNYIDCKRYKTFKIIKQND